jgi:hypothetical protein
VQGRGYVRALGASSSYFLKKKNLKNLRGKVQFSLFCVDMFCDGGVLKLSVASDLIRRVLMISELFFIVQEVPVAAPGLIRRLLMISELFYIVQEDLEAASGLFKNHSVV